MRIIITGANGLLGTGIVPPLKKHFNVISLDIDEWDIADEEQGRRTIATYMPQMIINLAAYTDVDGCETNIDYAYRVNAEAPGIIAGLCGKKGIRMIQFSTDYVFDGQKDTPYLEDDIPNPVSIYGKTKLVGEEAVTKRNPDSLIIRTQWLYGDSGDCFIEKIRRRAEQPGPIMVVNDQRGSPTYTSDLAEPLIHLIQTGKSGIYHAANSGFCTWFELANEVFARLNVQADISPITSDQLGRKAKRPANSAFDCNKLQRDTGIIMRPWQAALTEFLGKKTR